MKLLKALLSEEDCEQDHVHLVWWRRLFRPYLRKRKEEGQQEAVITLKISLMLGGTWGCRA